MLKRLYFKKQDVPVNTSLYLGEDGEEYVSVMYKRNWFIFNTKDNKKWYSLGLTEDGTLIAEFSEENNG